MFKHFIDPNLTLLFPILGLLFCLPLVAQNSEFADPEYYLVDSLILDDYTLEYQMILEDALEDYHNTTSAIEKLQALQKVSFNRDYEDCYLYGHALESEAQKFLQTASTSKDQRIGNTFLAKARALNAVNAFVHTENESFDAYMPIIQEQLRICEQYNDIHAQSFILTVVSWSIEIPDIQETFLQKNLTLWKAQGDVVKEAEASLYYNDYKWMAEDNLDSLNYYLSQIEPIFQKHQANDLLLELYFTAVIEFQNGGKVLESIQYGKKALEHLKIVKDTTDILWFMNVIGNNYVYLGMHHKAAIYRNQSLAIAKQTKSKAEIAVAIFNLGVLDDDLGRPKEAIQKVNQSIQLYKEVKDYRSLAFTYEYLASLLAKQNYPMDTVVALYQKSLAILHTFPNNEEYTYLYASMGDVYKDAQQYDSATIYYNKGLEYAQQTYIKHLSIEPLGGLSEIQRNLGNLNQAETIALKAHQIALQVDRPANISYTSDLLNSIYLQQKDYKSAYAMLELSNAMRDSLDVADLRDQTIINEMTAEYKVKEAQRVAQEKAKKLQAEAKAKTIAARKARVDNIQYSVIFLGIVGLFLSIFRLRQLNISNRLLEAIIFFAFLLLFELILLIVNPWLLQHVTDAPIIVLLVNAGVALIITPIHKYCEQALKKQLIDKPKTKGEEQDLD